MFHLSFRENCFLNVYHSESGVRNPSPRYRKFAVFGLPLCFFYSLPLLRLCIFTHHFPFFRSAGDTSQFSSALHFACCSLLLKDHFSRWQLRPEPTQVSGFPALGHEAHNLGPRLVLSIHELVFIWAVRFAKICCSRSFYWNKYLSSLVGPFISQARETVTMRAGPGFSSLRPGCFLLLVLLSVLLTGGIFFFLFPCVCGSGQVVELVTERLVELRPRSISLCSLFTCSLSIKTEASGFDNCFFGCLWISPHWQGFQKNARAGPSAE